MAEGEVLVMHSTLVAGSGRLLQSNVALADGRWAVRVAFSLAMLMEKGERGTTVLSDCPL